MFIQSLIEKYKEKVHLRDEACDALISKIDAALSENNYLFQNKSEYIDPLKSSEWKIIHISVINEATTFKINVYKKAKHFKALKEKSDNLHLYANNLPKMISSHNDEVINIKVQKAYELIGDVEERKLDHQQIVCVVKDAHNHLVIAGAGTGKTTTIVGKIKYLLRSGRYKPEDILVLSFTNASATEMRNRINKETGCEIAASTFHKLGLDIITKANGITPKITKINMQKFIKEQLATLMQDNKYLALLSSYLLYNRVVARSEFDFKTKTEYDEYLKLNPPTKDLCRIYEKGKDC